MNIFTKKTKAIIAGLLFTQVSFSFADIRLELGEGVNVLAINGQEVESDKFFSGITDINLPDGKNQILVTYTAEINRNREDFEIEKTKPFVILFSSNSDVLLRAPKKLNTLKKIERFEEARNWSLTDTKGNKVTFTSALLINGGFQLSRDYEDELADFNNTSSPAAVPRELIKSVKKQATNSIKSNKKSDQNKKSSSNTTSSNAPNMPLDMLIYWYNQADEKTRRSFKALIKNK